MNKENNLKNITNNTSVKTPEQLAKEIHKKTKGVDRGHYRSRKTDKETQNTIPKPRKPRKVNDFRESFFFMRKTPISDAALERLAERMIKWATSSPKKFVFNDFLNKEYIQAKQLDQWMKRSPILKNAKKIAMQVLAVNREQGALFKKIDYPTMRHMQGRYDPEWKAQEQYFNNLKKENSDKADTKIIVMEKFEDKD